MAGAEGIHQVAVIPAFLVFVANEQRNGCAGGFALEHAGQDLHAIWFAALGDMARSAGFTSIQFKLDVGFTQAHARRTAIHHTAYRRTVAFAEGSDSEQQT
jgi:hypothetical protein